MPYPSPTSPAEQLGTPDDLFSTMAAARRMRAEAIAAAIVAACTAARTGARRALAWVRERYAQNAAMRELSQMTDRELRDIGVVRSDIAAVAAGHGNANENRTADERAA